MSRLCLDCGATHTRPDPRCRRCYLDRQRARNATRAGFYDTAHRRLSEVARIVHPWCAICGATKAELDATGEVLTWDHEHRQVECRSCNSSHRRNPA